MLKHFQKMSYQVYLLLHPIKLRHVNFLQQFDPTLACQFDHLLLKLLLDEPASALDPVSTSKLEDTLKQLRSEYTMVMVTHNMQQAFSTLPNPFLDRKYFYLQIKFLQ